MKTVNDPTRDFRAVTLPRLKQLNTKRKKVLKLNLCGEVAKLCDTTHLGDQVMLKTFAQNFTLRFSCTQISFSYEHLVSMAD